MDDRKIINPLNFKDEDMPLFVLSDDLRSFIGWGIKAHSGGNYNHIMIMVKPGYIISQGVSYKEIPIKEYMKSSQMLKFWKYKNIIEQEKDFILTKAEADLKEPWWKRRYDYLGIVGQFFHIRWLNDPFRRYCSERVAEYLCLIKPIKEKIPKKPSPADLNRLFNQIPEFEVVGYYWED